MSGVHNSHNLSGVHPILRRWVYAVGETVPVTVVEGLRSPYRQKELYERGASTTLDSYHLKQPTGFAHAVDIAPRFTGEIHWDDLREFWILGGVGLAEARGMGVPITWGRDWDRDLFLDDQKFNDFAHWQIPRDFLVPRSGFS